MLPIMFLSGEQSLALIESLPQTQKTSTRFNTRSLKHTSFLASQKQQEREENRIRTSFQYGLLRFDRRCAHVEASVFQIRDSLS